MNQPNVSREMFDFYVKVALLELECLCHDAIDREDYGAALKACSDLVPMMNKYMDQKEGRENIVIERWLGCMKMIGVDFNKIEKQPGA